MQMCAIQGDTVKSTERFKTQAIGCHSLSAYRNSGTKILHGKKSYSYTDKGNFLLFFKLGDGCKEGERQGSEKKKL